MAMLKTFCNIVRHNLAPQVNMFAHFPGYQIASHEHHSLVARMNSGIRDFSQNYNTTTYTTFIPCKHWRTNHQLQKTKYPPHIAHIQGITKGFGPLAPLPIQSFRRAVRRQEHDGPEPDRMFHGAFLGTKLQRLR